MTINMLKPDAVIARSTFRHAASSQGIKREVDKEGLDSLSLFKIAVKNLGLFSLT